MLLNAFILALTIPNIYAVAGFMKLFGCGIWYTG